MPYKETANWAGINPLIVMQNHGKPLETQTGEVSGLLLLIILGLVCQGVSS